MRDVRFSSLILLLAACGCACSAQSGPAAQSVAGTPVAQETAVTPPAQTPAVRKASTPDTTTFKASAAEVIVPVTVTDEKGKFVSNLDAKDFELWDNGRKQTISFFTRERNQPVVIGYLVDLSNSNRLQWDKFREAIQDLVEATMEPMGNPDPRFSGYLIGYSTEPELMVNTTSDPEPLLDRVRKLKPGGASTLYDAIYMACTSRTLVKGEPIEPRRIIIVIGDGHDTNSKKRLEEVVEVAQRNLVTIYGVSTRAFGMVAEGDEALQRLTAATGGRVVYPLDDVYKDVDGYLSKPQDAGNFALTVGTGLYAAQIMKGIVNAIVATAGEIQLQYILRYIPAESDAAKRYRRIEVRVGMPNMKVRAREGYYPLPAQ
jgi:VWFA-related protein